MLTVIEKVIFLQNIDVFAEVPSEQLAELGAIAEEIEYLKGDTVFNEHDEADSLYLVLDGRVRLHRGDIDIAEVNDREAFGTWALFDDEPRVASATASENSRLLRIDRDDFFDLLADHIQIARGVLKTMVKRLRSLADRVSYNG